MGIFSGCLLVSDIDGTLYTGGKIPKRNLEMLEYFKSEGGFFSIATGRGPTAGVEICKNAGVNVPVLLCNGAVVFDTKAFKTLKVTEMPSSAFGVLKAVCEKFPEVGAEITYPSCIVTFKESGYTKEHRAVEGFEYTETAPYGEQPIKGLVMLKDQDRLKEVKAFMQSIKPDNCDYIATSSTFYEILAKGVSKALNLDLLCSICGADKNSVYCIGDCDNDLEMVKAASVGAFCENAAEHLKKQADYVAAPASEGAVADFINYIKTLRQK